MFTIETIEVAKQRRPGAFQNSQSLPEGNCNIWQNRKAKINKIAQDVNVTS